MTPTNLVFAVFGIEHSIDMPIIATLHRCSLGLCIDVASYG